MDVETTDEALMLAYARGDGGAFEALYRRHRQPLFRFVRSSVGDYALAEELFQDTWQRVVGARGRYRAEARFATWLYQIASNRLRDHWRASRHRPATPADAQHRIDSQPDPTSPGDVVSEFQQRRTLQLALASLPPEQREVVVLRLEQSLSIEEIARITGAGTEAVKSRLRYAVARLREGLKP